MWAAGWNFGHVTLIHVQKASKTFERSSALILMVNISTSTVFLLTWDGFQSTVGVSNQSVFDVTLVLRHRNTQLFYSSPKIQFFFFFCTVAIKDRCKLYCRVAGTTNFYQLKDRVADGTPCGTETNDICVQGLCRVSELVLRVSFRRRLLLLFHSTCLWIPLLIAILSVGGS